MTWNAVCKVLQVNKNVNIAESECVRWRWNAVSCDCSVPNLFEGNASRRLSERNVYFTRNSYIPQTDTIVLPCIVEWQKQCQLSYYSLVLIVFLCVLWSKLTFCFGQLKDGFMKCVKKCSSEYPQLHRLRSSDWLLFLETPFTCGMSLRVCFWQIPWESTKFESGVTRCLLCKWVPTLVFFNK